MRPRFCGHFTTIVIAGSYTSSCRQTSVIDLTDHARIRHFVVVQTPVVHVVVSCESGLAVLLYRNLKVQRFLILGILKKKGLYNTRHHRQKRAWMQPIEST